MSRALMLTAEEKHELLTIARESIACALEGKPHRREGKTGGGLARPSGAFVTIRINHQLRGCIGYIESSDPLAEVVSEVAVKSALEDPRFQPLTAPEFTLIVIEVSVLSPLTVMREISDIEIGVHGLLLQVGSRRGLLLPQVATEYGWNREEFLENVSRKAGLPREAWTFPEATVFLFTAEIIEEKATGS